jgi:hypothetical protein
MQPRLARDAARLGALVLVSATGPAAAQKIAPGLWEQTVSVSVGGGAVTNPMAGMQERLAKLPPERRKQMEAMLAQHGMGSAPGSNALRVCITPEQAARDAPPPTQNGCTSSGVQRSGNVMRFKYECAGPPPSSGEGEFAYASAKEWKGKVVSTQMRQGQPVRGETTMAGRWIAADCGNVRPLAMPGPGAPKK